MNKPVYIGQAVLDVRKVLMYEFWNGYLQPKYDDKLNLCYMDTDSLIFYVQTDHFYKDISNDVNDWFDTSGYGNDDNRIPIGVNKKVIDKFEDELNWLAMTEFIELASKVYAYKYDNDKVDRRVKGINKCVKDRVLRFEHYSDALLLNQTIRATEKRFKGDHHTIYT